VPTNPEKEAFGALAAELVAGQLGQTAEVYGYQITRYADRGDTGAERLVLREREPVQRAWGLYLFRIGQASNVIVEAPHPLSDEATPIIATSAYRALKARALLIAGARRDTNRDGSADVAHNARTVFQAMHQALVASGELVVLQFHGFSAARHDGYPQVVLSSPEPGAERLLDHMAGALRDKGLSVGVCNSGNWSELCGGTNAQALAVEDDTFIHIELDQSVREDAGALIVALERILGQ